MVFEDATHKDKLYLTHKNIAMDSKQADAVFKSPRRYYEIRKAKGIVMEQTSNRPAVNDDLNFNEIGLPKRR